MFGASEHHRRAAVGKKLWHWYWCLLSGRNRLWVFAHIFHGQRLCGLFSWSIE
nr:MAG TPA: hypothetical protein [Caudoviricetes sp.]